MFRQRLLPSSVLFILEPGLYTLIFASTLESAKNFKKWVFSTVHPSIIKYGYFKKFDLPNKLVFKIENENDLHTKIVQYIRKYYPDFLITPGLGELQDTSYKRIESHNKVIKNDNQIL